MKKAKTNPPGDGSVARFTLKAPGALSVLLAGDFTRWQAAAIPLAKDEDGLWSVTLALAPGAHRYRFIVDGQWQDDPDCVLRIPNPFGTEDNVRRF